MGRKQAAGFLAALGFALGVAAVAVAQGQSNDLPYRAYAPGITRADEPVTPTPTPKPVPYNGPVQSLHLASARVDARWPVEVRDTHMQGGREVFQDPTAPQRIAWYSRFGQPGFSGHNSLFAAHIDYIGFGKGPFGFLTSARAGDALYLRMDNGTELAYTVVSVEIIKLSVLDMDAVVFPPLGAGMERVTLISCGGTFVPYPGGGGEYDSRIILVAERYAG